jgi:hypothetical protein
MPSSSSDIPDDILSRPREERIQLAMAAIRESGMKSNGHPHYSVRQAAVDFDIPRSSLDRRLKGMWYSILSLSITEYL